MFGNVEYFNSVQRRNTIKVSSPFSLNGKLHSPKPEPTFVENLKAYLTHYCETTTIHGVKYIGEKRRYLIEKFLWFCVVIAVCSACLFLIHKTYIKWRTSPVIVSFETKETPIFEIPFPAVTICPEVKMNPDYFNFSKYFLKKIKKQSGTKREEKIFESLLMVCDTAIQYAKALGIESNTMFMEDDFYFEWIDSFVDIITETDTVVKFLGKHVEQFVTLSITEEGLCFSFNMLPLDEILRNADGIVLNNTKPSVKVNQWTLEEGYPPGKSFDNYPKRTFLAGVDGGFVIDGLYTNRSQIDYVCQEGCVAPPSELPNMDKHFVLPLNQGVMVAIKPTMITVSKELKNYDPDHRRCYFAEEKYLSMYKLYSQENCLMECLSNFTLKKCDCVSFWMPHVDGSKICGPGKDQCVKDSKVEYLSYSNRNEKGEVICECLPACTSLSYDIETSQTNWDWIELYKLYTTLNLSEPTININPTLSYFSKLVVYYKDLQFLTSRRHELYGVVDFFSNIGGLLGLFIVLTVCFYCTTLISKTYQKWLISPVIVSFETKETPIFAIPFPAVTVCPEVKIDPNYFNISEYILKRMGNVSVTEQEDKLFASILFICDTILQNIGWFEFNVSREYLGNDVYKELIRVSENNNETVIQFLRQNVDDFVVRTVTEEGICYTFNMLPLREILKTDIVNNSTIKRTKWSLEEGYPPGDNMDCYPKRTFLSGLDGGLVIDWLYVNRSQVDYVCKEAVQGFKVALHHPAELPNMDKILRLPLNQAVLVSIKPTMITVSKELRSYNFMDRKCYFPEEKFLYLYKFYSQQNCLSECLFNYTYKTCGCVTFWMPHFKDTKICGPGKSKCVDDSKINFLGHTKRTAKGLGSCNCLPACASLTYDVETSHTNWNWRELHKLHTYLNVTNSTWDPNSLVWICIVLTLCVSCTMLINESYYKWRTSPVIITYKTKEMPIYEIPFPAVTICSHIKMDPIYFNFTDHFFKKAQGINVTERDERLFDSILLTCDMNQDYLKSFGIECQTNFMDDSMYFDWYLRLDHINPDNERVLRFFGKDAKNLITMSVTEDGYCLTFNKLLDGDILRHPDALGLGDKRPDLNIRKWSLEEGYPLGDDFDSYPKRTCMSGFDGGFIIEGLYVNHTQMEYLCHQGLQAFKVVLHHPSEQPNMDKHFKIPLNHLVHVAIKPSLITVSKELQYYNPKDRGCYFAKEKYLSLYKLYTQENCLVECLSNFTVKNCDCVPFWMPRVPGVKICGPCKIDCIKLSKIQYLSYTNRNEQVLKPCECLPSCTSLTYNIETSESYWNWRKLRKLYTTLNMSDQNSEKDLGYYSKIIVYYKELQFLAYQRHEVYGVLDFFANVGGFLGLFIGFSVTSLIEIIHFLTMRIICNVKKCGKKCWSGVEFVWTCIVVTICIVCLFAVNRAYNKWKIAPVIVSFETKETSISEIPFPAVTICPEIKINPRYFNFTEHFLKKVSRLNVTEREEKLFDSILLVCDIGLSYKHYFGIEFNRDFMDEDFYDEWGLGVGPLDSENETVIQFLGSNVDYLMRQTITEAGFCYTFNMLAKDDILRHSNWKLKSDTDPELKIQNWSIGDGYSPGYNLDSYPKRTFMSGFSGGFLLDELFVNHSLLDYVCDRGVEGFKIVLHHPSELPNMDKHFRLPLNHISLVAIKPSLITVSKELRSYFSYERKCYFPNEKYLSLYKIYTQENCLVECLSNFTGNYCQCVPFWMPRVPGKNICGPGKKECVKYSKLNFLSYSNRNNKGSPQCDCLPACTSLSYDVEISQTKWNWKELYKNDAFLNLTNTDFNPDTSDYSRISLYFKDVLFLSYRRHEVHGVLDFFSNVGGLMGLFIGFSLISVVEIIYFFTLRIFCNVTKLFWIGAFIAVYSVFLLLINQTYYKWKTSPVMVSFNTKETPIFAIPFPAVTVCSETKIDSNYFNFTEHVFKKVRNINVTEREEKLFDSILLTCKLNQLLGKKFGIKYERNFMDEDFWKEWLLGIRDLDRYNTPILEFLRKNISDLIQILLTEDGFCYTFNMLPQDEILRNTEGSVASKSKRNVKMHKWSLEDGYPLEDDLDSYPKRTFMTGIGGGLVMLHHPSEFPNIDRRFRLPLNHLVLVAIKPSMITVSKELHNYHPKDRGCYFADEKYLSLYKLYTQQNCLSECYFNFTLRYCDCVPFWMPRSTSSKICGPGKIECLKKSKINYLSYSNRNQKEIDQCECLPPCTSLSYDIETSKTKWNWRELSTFYATLNITSKNFLPHLSHFSKLIVYYKDLQFLTSQRHELHGWVEFFSNVGGLLGFFIGFSVISAIEVIHFCSLRIFCNIKKYSGKFWSGDPNVKNM
ncbi:hypothetical protein FQR65_LT01866 [Abscondita terminalis]|nr:hypothetical protein FQR65_LT01866 [Abscondita terminalis]